MFHERTLTPLGLCELSGVGLWDPSNSTKGAQVFSCCDTPGGAGTARTVGSLEPAGCRSPVGAPEKSLQPVDCRSPVGPPEKSPQSDDCRSPVGHPEKSPQSCDCRSPVRTPEKSLQPGGSGSQAVRLSQRLLGVTARVILHKNWCHTLSESRFVWWGHCQWFATHLPGFSLILFPSVMFARTVFGCTAYHNGCSFRGRCW